MRVEREAVPAAVAAALIAEQYPEWAHLPLRPVALDGWDNTTFRLGDELSVRLPTADRYAPQVAVEHRWLPLFAPSLLLRVPEPVATGRPSDRFPRPWSIYRWIGGTVATVDGIRDGVEFASDLAQFLAALHKLDARDGPHPGLRNFFRGGPLGVYDTEARQLIDSLADNIDYEEATEVWERAIATSWQRPPVWVHGDVSPSNLLVVDGRLSAVIDFGSVGVGDPACDLVMAWTFFDDDGRDAARRTLALDVGTWARARGWALWKALLTLAREKENGESADNAARRFGWRGGASEVLDRVLASGRTRRQTAAPAAPGSGHLRDN